VIVVSDTSPILSLARIDRLDLLESLYGQVLIPPAVFAELETSLSDWPTPIALNRFPWMVVVEPTDTARLSELQRDLDPGEAEAIALAIERKADLLLVDERRGRRTARASGVRVTGLLGVIAQAKRTGLIGEAKPVIDALRDVGRFWIGRALYQDVLAELGES
jgi:predicted nucleic acid-binding protein